MSTNKSLVRIFPPGDQLIPLLGKRQVLGQCSQLGWLFYLLYLANRFDDGEVSNTTSPVSLRCWNLGMSLKRAAALSANKPVKAVVYVIMDVLSEVFKKVKHYRSIVLGSFPR